MMKRTAGFLLILLLSGCSLLPTPPVEEPTAAPSTVVNTPALPTIIPTTAEPNLTETPALTGTVVVSETPALTVTLEDTTVPSESETPFVPTGMAELTSTPTPYVSPTAGPSPTRAPVVSDKAYIPQEGTPRLIKSFTPGTASCQWMGIAGQVFGAGGAPMTNLVVVVSGELNGQLIDSVGLTGLATPYGEGGFEIQVTNAPVASQQALSIQIFDLLGGELSDPFPFDTSSACSENLIIINFVPNS